MEGPGKQYPCEKTGDLLGRFKPIEEPGAEEKDPVVFTGLETVWVTVDKVGIPTSSIMPEPSGAGVRVGGLAGPVPSRPKVGIPTLSTVTHTVSRPVNTTRFLSITYTSRTLLSCQNPLLNSPVKYTLYYLFFGKSSNNKNKF
jgi:hypothetical protein